MRISDATERVDAQARRTHGEHDAESQPPGAVAWALVVGMVVVLAAGGWRDHPAASLLLPAAAVAAWWPTLRSSRHDRWLFFYVAGIYVYTILRSYADDAGLPLQVSYVVAFDRLLFGGTLPSAQLQQGLFEPGNIDWVDAAASAVHASFFVVPHAVLVLVWWRRPSALRPYVLSALLTFYLGLVLFFVAPTAPPWLASHYGDVPHVHRVIDFVYRGLEVGAYDELYSSLAEPNSLAAVPSIHMAITCVVLFRASVVAPRWVWPLAGYTVLMAASLVYLGEHYVFDIVAGVLIAAASEVAVRRAERLRAGDARAIAVAALTPGGDSRH